MFGMDIASIRKSMGISQAEFAVRLGISHKYVSHLETGGRKPSLKLSAKIEAISGVHGLVQARIAEKMTSAH